MTWLYDWLQSFLAWLLDAMMYVPRWLWQEVLSSLSALIAAIPVPQAFSLWISSASSLANGVVWFLNLLQFKAGLVIILGALLARFVLRRIPFIG